MAKASKIWELERGRATQGLNSWNYTRDHKTLEEWTQYFAYTLEVGNSWDKKISRNPKTIQSLVDNVNRSYDIKGEVRSSLEFMGEWVPPVETVIETTNAEV